MIKTLHFVLKKSCWGMSKMA